MAIFKKIIPGILLSFITCTAHAETPYNGESYEAHVVKAFLLYCLPPLTLGVSASSVADKDKLPELPPKAEYAFLAGEPGKAYGLPSVGEGAVLLTPEQPFCSVLVHTLDAKKLIEQTDYWFNPAHTPFRMDKYETLPGGEIARKYRSTIGGADISVLIKVRPESAENETQALLTAARQGK